MRTLWVGFGLAMLADSVVGHDPSWELVHKLAVIQVTASVIATVLLRWIPTPDEITARWYRVLYNTVRRISYNGSYHARKNGDVTVERRKQPEP